MLDASLQGRVVFATMRRMTGTDDRWGAGPYETLPAAALAVWQFRVERERAAVGQLNDALEKTLQAQIPDSALRALQVALDELLTNVIMHARRASGAIDVQLARGPDTLEVVISYSADPFDPTTRRALAPITSVSSARIGGLGIELVRLLMDDFRHDYADGRNVLSLSKKC